MNQLFGQSVQLEHPRPPKLLVLQILHRTDSPIENGLFGIVKILGRNFKVEKRARVSECQVAARSDRATDRPTDRPRLKPACASCRSRRSRNLYLCRHMASGAKTPTNERKREGRFTFPNFQVCRPWESGPPTPPPPRGLIPEFIQLNL